jgi:hypothetical protein
LATKAVHSAPPATKPVMGKVAIHALGAKFKPTKPLTAMKVTLLMRKKPWHRVSKISEVFMASSLTQFVPIKLSAANTASGAVSARSTRGPSEIAMKRCCRASASSASVKPPSGPLKKRTSVAPASCV